MLDSVAPMYDLSASLLPGAGSQVLFGRYNLCSLMFKDGGGLSVLSLREKCSFNVSLQKNALDLVSSLTFYSVRNSGIRSIIDPDLMNLDA